MYQTDRVYLDYNAGAPLLECAYTAMLDVLGRFGNPSSVHAEGREARKQIEAARCAIADLVGADPANIVFCSGATEAAHYALSQIYQANTNQVLKFSHLFVGATEHPCILQGGQFCRDNISQLPVTSGGAIDLPVMDRMLGAHDHMRGAPLVAIQFANSETGVIQSLPAIAECVHEHKGILVVDAVQALGKMPFQINETGADVMIFSSHKIGGPQGTGAVVLADGGIAPYPLLRGGGQENYRRAGTENVAAISGFGAACTWHLENLKKNINKFTLRESIEEKMSAISRKAGNGIAQPVFFGKSEKRLGNTSCFAVAGIKAETALVALDLEGIAVSSGSACSSGKVRQSHVLDAMGMSSDEMDGALRISLGWATTNVESARFLNVWKTMINRMAAL